MLDDKSIQPRINLYLAVRSYRSRFGREEVHVTDSHPISVFVCKWRELKELKASKLDLFASQRSRNWFCE